MKNLTIQEIIESLQDNDNEKLENTILNYEDYKNEYVDSIYQFIIDYSIFYIACDNEEEGLDFIIDYLEEQGCDGCFIDVKTHDNTYVIDTENNKYYDDVYIIGGNHGKCLYHGGNFYIKELNI